MLVALDVGYESRGDSETGRCGVVAFPRWNSDQASVELSVPVPQVREYVSGRLFERELPCLLAGLEALQLSEPGIEFDAVLVDGNVRLDNCERPGLGMHLYKFLNEAVPVIGVAKTAFKGLQAVRVLRGSSSRPLYVTAAGIDEHEAAQRIHSMNGSYRLPTLIRRADQLSRQESLEPPEMRVQGLPDDR